VPKQTLYIGPYLERVFKDVSACFCQSILISRIMNNKDRMTKTRANIFKSAF